VITLILLHPFQAVPVQSWSFEENDSTIKIGRATDNQVVLYSAVVSRYHVELRRRSSNWEVVNLGTNGTYVDGKSISKVTVTNGTIIHLARSGPKIQIRFGNQALEELKAISAEETIAQQAIPEVRVTPQGFEEVTAVPLGDTVEMPPPTQIPH
jgi:pSer/pThr/pTyr-binding forkhead associated (FHA) protein